MLGRTVEQAAERGPLGGVELVHHLRDLGGPLLEVQLGAPALGGGADDARPPVVGVDLCFIGALVFHVRAKDKELAPAAVLMLVAVAALVLRLATA